MTPELKQTLEIIIAGMSLLICLVLLISFAILSNKLRELRKVIRQKDCQIKRNDEIIKGFSSFRTHYAHDSFKYYHQLKEAESKIRKYEFVMAVSDDISAELVKENEELLYKVDLLKSKLNHKKRPCKCKK